MSPVWPGTNIPSAQPLPAGASIDTVLEIVPRWTPEAAIDTIATIAAAEQQLSSANIIKPTGVDFQAAASMIGAGAGIGTMIFPGIGTAIGAAVGLIAYAVDFLVNSGGNTNYPNAPQAVIWWINSFAETAFVQNALDTGQNTWSTEKQVAQAQLLYWLERWGCVLVNSGQKFYSGIPDSLYIGYAGGEDEVAEMYKNVMVDYWATKQARMDAGVLDTGLSYDVTVIITAKVMLQDTDEGDDEGEGDDESNTGALLLLGTVAAGAYLIAAHNNS